ncbi:hypothetical protein PPYR_03646 [Photinus pyralis]|uniref:Amino acid transporter transmembrane domain-containing protein n=2 Tax=Photinus pyralis TaxID=7054 RepID=A0A5N4A3F8_PHOPY|nr:proton-coupled amino acid transporter-like protein CG1139 [Photinus pyralis]KAB0791846.1 hypothetical protein PPYR_03646 [Photinus pyralis]
MDDDARSRIAEITTRYVVDVTDDDYDPYVHRNVEHATSYLETLVHILKASLGTGVLAMPIAFKYAGLVNGVIGAILTAFVCGVGIHRFFASQYTICKNLKVSYMPYSVIMKVALLSGPRCMSKVANFFGTLSDALLLLHQTGVCAVYVIFISNNLKDLLKRPYTNLNVPVEYYMLCLLPALLLIVSVPNMKKMARITLLSNCATLVSVIIIIAVLSPNLPDISLRHKTGTVFDSALAFGIMLFALSAMGVILTVEKHMKEPKQMVAYFGTLNVSLVAILIVYTLIGFIGYWQVGDEVKDIIILDLQNYNETARQCAQSLYVVAIFVSYGLSAMVFVDVLWGNYLKHYLAESRHHDKGQCATRILVVFVSTFAAAAIPLFADIVALLGSFSMSSLELIFPAIMDICVRWPDKFGRGKWTLIADLILMAIGVGGLLIGGFSAIRSIVRHLNELRG